MAGTALDCTLEVVGLPVSDLERSVEFHHGFGLDHFPRDEHMHVAGLTPRGSRCSMLIGDLPVQTRMTSGSMRAPQLCVPGTDAARAGLVARGVTCDPVVEVAPGDGDTFLGFWPLLPHETRGRAGG